MMNATQGIGKFIVKTKYQQIPKDVIEIAKLHILDTLGCMLAGSQEEAAQIMAHYVSDFGANYSSSIIPLGVKTTPAYAALANGVAGHVLDYDDYEWPSMAHPSVTVLPAVLAMGEKLRAGGKECLEAYLVGMEVISRVGMGINPSHYDKGWHSTGTLGTLGSASASAKLLKLGVERTKAALGIAASMSSGLRGNFGTMTKPFHAGHAARNGVEAAVLASMGFTARQNILEHELGFCHIFTERDEFDQKKITNGLGNPFSILSPGVGRKLYPSCAATHSVLDGVFHLIHNHNIRAEDVNSVECGIFYLYPTMLIYPRPKTGLEGKFSLEFCVALALTERAVRLKDFIDDKVNDSQIQMLIKRVKKFVTHEIGGRETQYPGATIKMRLKNGKSYSHKVITRKGSPSNPLVIDEIINKFSDCTGLIHSNDRVGRIIDAVKKIDEIDDIGKFVTLTVEN